MIKRSVENVKFFQNIGQSIAQNSRIFNQTNWRGKIREFYVITIHWLSISCKIITHFKPWKAHKMALFRWFFGAFFFNFWSNSGEFYAKQAWILGLTLSIFVLLFTKIRVTFYQIPCYFLEKYNTKVRKIKLKPWFYGAFSEILSSTVSKAAEPLLFRSLAKC